VRSYFQLPNLKFRMVNFGQRLFAHVSETFVFRITVTYHVV
jgi:hypothetical protein